MINQMRRFLKDVWSETLVLILRRRVFGGCLGRNARFYTNKARFLKDVCGETLALTLTRRVFKDVWSETLVLIPRRRVFEGCLGRNARFDSILKDV